MAYGKHYHPHFIDWETCLEGLADLRKATE